jgi:diacylglycerol kinase (ATP)
MTIVGGDGSLMTLAQEAIDEGVNLDSIAMCILPFGTGNDLSKVLGFGSKPK